LADYLTLDKLFLASMLSLSI